MSSVNDNYLEPCCSETVSTTNLTSSTLPRVSEPTYQSTNEVLSMGATAPVACTVYPLRPTEMSVVVVDNPNHFPGSLPSGMEPEEYMDQMEYVDKCLEMGRCNKGLRSALDVPTIMIPAINCQQQQTRGDARCADSRESMRLSLSTDRLATNSQVRDADGCVYPAIVFHPRDMDENGYMHMSCEVRIRVYYILNSDVNF